MSNEDTTREKVEVWYCEAIEKVRICSDPGGDALTLVGAKELRDELDAAIQTAERGNR